VWNPDSPSQIIVQLEVNDVLSWEHGSCGKTSVNRDEEIIGSYLGLLMNWMFSKRPRLVAL